MAGDDDFLSRWSRRKMEQGRPDPDQAIDGTPDADAVRPGTAEEPVDPDDHPAADIDIDALDYQSDFTVFMHEKVPEAVRRRALRQLWQSNPILANVDGLNDYDEDFTDAAVVVEGLKQAYDEARKRMKDAEAADTETSDDTPDDEVAVVAESDEENGTEADEPRVAELPADDDDGETEI